MELTPEATLRAAILKWCRDTAVDGVRGMRRMRNTCLVMNLEKTEPDPNAKYNWGRRPIIYAEGATWGEVAEKLGVQT